MAQTSRAFLAGLRSILWFGKIGVKSRHRRRLRRHEETSHICESLEQRQLLVAQPISLTVSSGTTTAPITVQWVQPSTSPAVSFDVTVTRTGLVSGGIETVLTETAWPAVSAPGSTYTYTITEPLPAGSYSVAIVARGSDASVSAATTNTFVVTQLAPQMLRVSGKKLVGANTPNAPIVSSAVALSWTVLPGVNSYYVKIEKKNTATPAEYLQIADLAPRSVQGGVYEGNLVPGDYKVSVRDLNILNPIASDWSLPMDFTVAGSDALFPAWNSTAVTMGQGGALSWTAGPSAVRYDVEITGGVTTTASVAGTEYRGGFLAAGGYSARVRGFDANNQPLPWSVALPFTITATSYQPQITSSPAGVAANGIAPIVWNPIGWADTYEVTLQIAAGAVQFRERIRATTYTPPLLPVNSYTVSIKAVDTFNASTTAVTTPTFQVVSDSTYKPAPPTFVQSTAGPQLTSK